MGIAYNTSIVRSGLVLHLDAANPKSYPGTGTAWNDISGKGTNGTLINDPTYNNENRGSLVFDGINDYVNTGYDLSWNNTNSASITIAVKPSSISVYRPFLGKGPVNWEWQLNQKNTSLEFVYWNSSGGHTNGPIPEITNIFLNTTSYVEITVVWNHTTNSLYFYRNGVLVNTTVWVDASINQNRTDTVNIGGSIYQWGTQSSYWSGSVAFLKFYNKALSANEVQQNFEARRGRFGI